ncbi:MAG: GntR family transcriptional regulator [Eubacterium sp.]|nr:GntR family transcriptional regulator [Eubacterium sp.]
MERTEKSYEKTVDYIKEELLNGHLRTGDRLPSERELAEVLGSSRNSVREGLRVLENLGVVTSCHGSGNFISLNFDETMSELLSFMYFLKGIREDQVTEFRRSMEWEAMYLAVERITIQEKEEMLGHLEKLEAVQTEDARVQHDKAIHEILIAASHNDFLITNYKALNNLMDRYIRSMRARIISGMNSHNMLAKAHRELVEGVVEGDLEKGLHGVLEHFRYIEVYGK